MLTELIVLFICYLGLVAGFFIGKATKEEILAGKKYLKITEWILKILAIGIFFLTFKENTTTKFVILGIILLMEFLIKNNSIWLGILCGLNTGFLFSVIVFLHGFPQGSLMNGRIRQFIKKTGVFLLVGMLAYFARIYLLI